MVAQHAAGVATDAQDRKQGRIETHCHAWLACGEVVAMALSSTAPWCCTEIVAGKWLFCYLAKRANGVRPKAGPAGREGKEE